MEINLWTTRSFNILQCITAGLQGYSILYIQNGVNLKTSYTDFCHGFHIFLMYLGILASWKCTTKAENTAEDNKGNNLTNFLYNHFWAMEIYSIQKQMQICVLHCCTIFQINKAFIAKFILRKKSDLNYLHMTHGTRIILNWQTLFCRNIAAEILTLKWKPNFMKNDFIPWSIQISVNMQEYKIFPAFI